MSRSGYGDDDGDNPRGLVMWRGAVNSALTGKRGQAFLRELLAALDAMPDKSLTTGELQADGEFCALGVVGQARGLDLAQMDTEDWKLLSSAFGIAQAMAREIMYENDEGGPADHKFVEVEICGPVRPHYPDWGRHTVTVSVANKSAGLQRWAHMRAWAASNLAVGPPAINPPLRG